MISRFKATSPELRAFPSASRYIRTDGQSAFPIAIDPRAIRATSAEARRGRLLATLRAALRPVKPLIEPRAAPALRLLSRMARGLSRARIHKTPLGVP